MCTCIHIFDQVFKDLTGVAMESDHPSLYAGPTGHTWVTLDTLLSLFQPYLSPLENKSNDRIGLWDDRS